MSINEPLSECLPWGADAITNGVFSRTGRRWVGAEFVPPSATAGDVIEFEGRQIRLVDYRFYAHIWIYEAAE